MIPSASRPVREEPQLAVLGKHPPDPALESAPPHDPRAVLFCCTLARCCLVRCQRRSGETACPGRMSSPGLPEPLHLAYTQQIRSLGVTVERQQLAGVCRLCARPLKHRPEGKTGLCGRIIIAEMKSTTPCNYVCTDCANGLGRGSVISKRANLPRPLHPPPNYNSASSMFLTNSVNHLTALM